MCGRYTLKATPVEIQEALNLPQAPRWAARYNIAPTHMGLVLTTEGATLMRWGAARTKAINTRVESLSGSSSAHRRCLVVCDGFYEWSHQRTPFYFHLEDHSVFTVAGILWPNGFTIVTRPAADPVSQIHLRMPAFIEERHRREWLESERVAMPLEPVRTLTLLEVGPEVNSAAHDSPACLAPAKTQQLRLL
jgi:putative SOS response-associated peptidase YedK